MLGVLSVFGGGSWEGEGEGDVGDEREDGMGDEREDGMGAEMGWDGRMGGMGERGNNRGE